MNRKDITGKWYSNTSHFAAICSGPMIGITVAPRFASGKTADGQWPLLFAGCVGQKEWECCIDALIRDLRKLRSRGPSILERYYQDMDKVMDDLRVLLHDK